MEYTLQRKSMQRWLPPHPGAIFKENGCEDNEKPYGTTGRHEGRHDTMMEAARARGTYGELSTKLKKTGDTLLTKCDDVTCFAYKHVHGKERRQGAPCQQHVMVWTFF